MSWKFGGIYIKKNEEMSVTALLDRLQLSLSPTGQWVNLDNVTSTLFYKTAIGDYQGITLIHNNFLPYDCAFESGKIYEFDKILCAASNKMDILCFFLDGITSSYGISLFSYGNRIRCRGVMSNQLVLDEGDLLPMEKDITNMDEENRIIYVISDFLDISFKDLLEDNSLLLEIYSD